MRLILVLLLVPASIVCASLSAGDWPTYNHDASRSGVADETLTVPLTEAWIHTPPNPPQPAWPRPAKADFWHNLSRLEARVIYDRAFHVAVAGESLFYGSSADDRVACLDVRTGSERWSFVTDGPVRLAPFVSEGRVYAGSDDGSIYCLDAGGGGLLWTRNPSGIDRCVIGNGRMISAAPVRTGVIVVDGIAYCCAGIFPKEGVFLAAYDALSGENLWRTKPDLSPQGYMLASASRLYLPTGRTAPMAFNRSDGAALGAIKGSVGAYALVTEDLVVTGPGNKGELGLSAAPGRDHLATFPGLRMIIDGSIAYLHSKTALSAFDRTRYVALLGERRGLSARVAEIEKQLNALGKEAGAGKGKKLKAELDDLRSAIAARTAAMQECTLWQAPCAHPYALILAGDLLVAGGEESIAAFGTADGKQLWTGTVPGRVYGLAVAGGRLFASSDTGSIHCFRAE